MSIIPQRGRRFTMRGPVQMLCLLNTGELPVGYCRHVEQSAIGATFNVAANLLTLNRNFNTGVLTALATDAHGEFILREIRRAGVMNSSDMVTCVADLSYQSPCMSAGFPIGSRGQVPVVRRWCDPMAKLTASLAESYWDFDKLMKETELLHLCLHELGLNEDMAGIYMRLVEAAKKNDVTVMVNLNFRKPLFPTDEAMNQWHAYCQMFAAKADILVGSKAMALKDLAMPQLEVDKAKSILARFPNLRLVALTGRDPNPTAPTYSGELAISQSEAWTVNPRPCVVRWQIGSGDAFDAALIYGILSGWKMEKTLSFAVDYARDNLSTVGDQSMATPEQILAWASTAVRT